MTGKELTTAINLGKDAAKILMQDIRISRDTMEPGVFAHYADTLADELLRIHKDLQHEVRQASKKKLI